MVYPESTKRLLMDTIHYVSNSILAKDKRFILDSPRPVLTVLCLLPGWVLSRVVIKKGKL